VRRALIVVDVQNDFTESGPFPCDGNDAIARRIGSYVSSQGGPYTLVVTTQDWHVDASDHFVKHPVHCVADTAGAELDPELDAGAGGRFLDLVDLVVRKGFTEDDYSGFNAVDASGTPLPRLLERADIAAVDVCGFAEDGCVAATVRDALTSGYAVRLLTDLSAASSPAAAAQVETELVALGAVLAKSGLVGGGLHQHDAANNQGDPCHRRQGQRV
jgi:nicotinamidase/pyrazinamidase